MFKKLIACVLLFAAHLSFAKVFHLVEIYNQEDHEVSVMYLNLNEYGEILSYGKKIFLDGELIEDENLGTELSYEGIVLEEQKSKNVVILRGLNMDAKNGGALEIDYLYNGITGSRGRFSLDINRTSNGWQLTQKGKIIKRMLFESHRKRFVGTVGIRRIIILK